MPTRLSDSRDALLSHGLDYDTDGRSQTLERLQGLDGPDQQTVLALWAVRGVIKSAPNVNLHRMLDVMMT